jgi:hypothetical protein
MSVYTPKAANPNDGELITLCKILEASSGANPAWNRVDLSNYDGNGNPGTIVFTVGGATTTLTLTWSGTNLTSVVRS